MSKLRYLWAGMLTRNTGDAGTDSRIMLIVNENGFDRLHHTFPDTSQRDQEQGEANLYEIPVAGDNIVPENLNNSSLRVGIRGDDKWAPEHFIVWGERFTSGAITPIAIETDLRLSLSTDANEGNLSFPVRLVDQGSANMSIKRLLILMTTADAPNASTDDPVELQITGVGGSLVVDFNIPDTPQYEQERAQANFYFVPVSSEFTKNSLNSESIRLNIKGSDAWLPKSFFLFGLDDATGRPESLVPLVHIRNWTLGWLSTDSSEGKASVTLPQV